MHADTGIIEHELLCLLDSLPEYASKVYLKWQSGKPFNHLSHQKEVQEVNTQLERWADSPPQL